MAIVRVNVQANESWSPGVSTTFNAGAQSATGGNALVVCVGGNATAGQAVTGVTDTAGNAYVKVDHVFEAGDLYREEIWYATNITGHASNDVMVTWSAAVGFLGITVIQYAGLVTPAPLDITAKGTNAGGITVTSSAFTSAADTVHLVLGRWGTSPTYPAGFSEIVSTTQVHTGERLAAGAYSGTYTLTGGLGFNKLILVATFLAAGAGGTIAPAQSYVWLPV